MDRAFHRMIVSTLAILAVASCGKKDEAPAPQPSEAAQTAPEENPNLPASEWTDARADLSGPNGEAMGEVEFQDGLGGVLIRVHATGLAPGWHGIHLHQIADCSDGAEGFKASGGHINPDETEHGLLNPNGSHRADIPNLFAGADGAAHGEFFRAGINLKPSEEGAALNGPYPLLDDDGFAVIIHESPDDHLTQPIGGAGARIACAEVKD